MKTSNFTSLHVITNNAGRKLIALICLIAVAHTVFGQYLETFSTPNKGYLINFVDDLTGVNWTMSSWSPDNTTSGFSGRDATDYFQTTAAGVLESIDLDQEVYWESPLIDISSAGTVSLSVGLVWNGFDNDVVANSCISGPYGTNATLDVIKVQYSINGGAYSMIPNQVGGATCATIGYASGAGTGINGSTTVTATGLSGSTIRIRVVVNTNANAEVVQIDNVSIPQSGVTLYCTQPTVNLSPVNIVCNGANSGAIKVTASGATSGYNVSWAGPSSGNPGGTEIASSGGMYTITSLAAGMYSVSVSDATGCTISSSTTIISSPITQSATISPDICNEGNGTIDLTPGGGNMPYTYLWSNGATTQDISGLAAGFYTVTITDASGPGCTSVQVYAVPDNVDGPYQETFSVDGRGYLINQVNNFFGVNWTLSPWTYDEPPANLGRDNGDYLRTAGGKLSGTDTDEEVCWTSPFLNIGSSGSVSFGVDLTWASFDPEDYISVQFRTGNGAFTKIPNGVGGGTETIQYTTTGNNGSTNIVRTGITGDSLQIRVCFNTNSQNDTFSLDNVNVPNTVSLCFATDTTPPMAVCKDLTVDLDATGNRSIVAQDLDGGSTDATGITIYMASQTGFDCTDLGVQMVTLTVSDAAGNSASCVAMVTVRDTVPPALQCPMNFSNAQVDGNCQNALADYRISVMVTDNCDTMPVLSQNPSPGTITGTGMVDVTVYATDASGNIDSCQFVINVVDNIPPIAACKDVTVYADDNGMATLSPGDLNNGSTDNCNIFSYQLTSDLVKCNPMGFVMDTLIVTDDNGNADSCQSTITIIDTIGPVILNNPGDLIGYQGGAGCGGPVSWPEVTGTDNCCLQSLVVSSVPSVIITTFMGTTGSNNFPATRVTSVKYVATDCFGNKDSIQFSVTVLDTTPPRMTCKDITLYLDGNGSAGISPFSTLQSFYDACGLPRDVYSKRSFNCSDIGSQMVTTTLTDQAGNSNSCSSNVSVVDTVSPVARCQDITTYLDGMGSGSIADIDVDAGSTDNCSVTSYSTSPKAFTCADIGPNAVVLTVADQSMNSKSCMAMVTVLDTTRPLITCQDITVYLDGVGYGSIIASFAASVTDACDIDTLYASQSEFTCQDLGTKMIYLIVRDVSGNKDSCLTPVTVFDPFFYCCDTPSISCPADITVTADPFACEVPVSYADPTVMSNCTPVITQLSGPASDSMLYIGMYTVQFEASNAPTKKDT
ncbi:MAG TPA: HYR domain-containing protein, partial [Saprospiraceae bacterium]|nr:HYR domain-containing protein [Saprospiraceae bacterium]